MFFDCHTHTFLSDGELGPAELAQRAETLGISGVAFTDHVDPTTVDHIVGTLANGIDTLREHFSIHLLVGCEITHTPPAAIEATAIRAREQGAEIVVVHGQSPVEPVPEGTNLAAVESEGVDVLAHPGFVTDDVLRGAAQRGVSLEISGRKGHSLTNGFLVQKARKYDVDLVVNTDSHAPGDLIDAERARAVVRGAGHPDPDRVLKNNEVLFQRILEG